MEADLDADADADKDAAGRHGYGADVALLSRSRSQNLDHSQSLPLPQPLPCPLLPLLSSCLTANAKNAECRVSGSVSVSAWLFEWLVMRDGTRPEQEQLSSLPSRSLSLSSTMFLNSNLMAAVWATTAHVLPPVPLFPIFLAGCEPTAAFVYVVSPPL